MGNFQVWGLLACLLLPGASWAYGQPPRRPPGERDPFFEAMVEVHQESLNKELFDLLNHASIRQEIKLSDDDAEKVKENIGAAIREMIKLRESSRGQNKSKDVLKSEIQKAVSPFDDSSYQLLKQNANFDRLLGIYVQARNYRAVLNAEVAANIGLSAEELAKFREARSKAWRQLMGEMRKEIEEEIRNRDPNEGEMGPVIVKYFEQAERKLDATLREELTPAQRAKLLQLKGEPFQLPERLFEFPGRRGGRGRRDDHGDRPAPAESKCGGDKCARISKDLLVYF